VSETDPTVDGAGRGGSNRDGATTAAVESATGGGETGEDVAAYVDLLETENSRLRRDAAAAHRAHYRRTALGFLALALLAGGGAVTFPDLRGVLLALAGIGGFAAVLSYYLTPEQVLAASSAERVYGAYATTGEALVDDLGLQETYVYLPARSGAAGGASVRLFVPQAEEYVVPDPGDLDGVIVGADDRFQRGIAVYPTGGALFREFEQSLTEPLAEEPTALSKQLARGLVEVFEFVEDATVEPDTRGGRVTVGVTGTAYGAIDRFDHPVSSFLGAGLAHGLDHPVQVAVEADGSGRFDALVACDWSREGAAGGDETSRR